MKAMILAAGRGERMRPLTDTCPKPLLPVAGKPLIVWHLEALAAAGVREVVINHAHLGHCLEAALGDGRAWGVNIRWSAEIAGGLETAGGIRQALPLLTDIPTLSANPEQCREELAQAEAFLVVNGDVFCQPDYAALLAHARQLRTEECQAHLLLVDNPAHNPSGDFAFPPGQTGQRLTFSGIAAYHPALFAGVPSGEKVRLAPLLHEGIARGQIRLEHYTGRWVDVGTPQRLSELDSELRSQTLQT